MKQLLRIVTKIYHRDHVFLMINISSLCVGLTSAIFIFMWVSGELSFDRFHQDGERIYNVMENQRYQDRETISYEATPAPLAEKLKEVYPEVESAARASWEQRILLRAGEKSFFQYGFHADLEFFKVFSFPLVEGDQKNVLPDLNSIVISRRLSRVYFGDSPALGKVLETGDGSQLKITAVIDELPGNSSILFDFVLPFGSYSANHTEQMDWGHHVFYTYLKLKPGTSGDSFSEKIRGVIRNTHPENANIELFLWKLSDWHLRSEFENGVQRGGRITYVIIFSFVALFILVAACINFMNLATARAARRAREVGIRKMSGATVKSLIGYFMSESMIIAFASLVFALVSVYLLTPLFNVLTGRTLSMDYSDPKLIAGVLAITIFAGLLAGSYPAFFLSSFKPAAVLKGNLSGSSRTSALRRSLVIFQFALSTVLITAAIAVNRQIQFMKEKNIGFDREHVFYFEPRLAIPNFEAFSEELRQNAAILSVGRGYDNPLNIFNNDNARWDGLSEGETITIQSSVVRFDYIPTMGFTLLKGRQFSPDLASDTSSFIINEEFARRIGVDDPIGKKIYVYQKAGYVIGIVKNFHHRDFHGLIEPFAFVMEPEEKKPMTVFVRYSAGAAETAVEHVRRIYKKFIPSEPLEVSFIDGDFDRMYRIETMVGRLSLCFTVVIVFISCIGLLGLTLFTTERRTKEIGVRKVLGASVPGVIWLLCADFIKPVLTAAVFGFPLAWYSIEYFLSGYSFHIENGFLIYAVTGTSIVLLAITTVAWQSLKAARTNPADTLRME